MLLSDIHVCQHLKKTLSGCLGDFLQKITREGEVRYLTSSLIIFKRLLTDSKWMLRENLLKNFKRKLSRKYSCKYCKEKHISKCYFLKQACSIQFSLHCGCPLPYAVITLPWVLTHCSAIIKLSVCSRHWLGWNQGKGRARYSADSTCRICHTHSIALNPTCITHGTCLCYLVRKPEIADTNISTYVMVSQKK